MSQFQVPEHLIHSVMWREATCERKNVVPVSDLPALCKAEVERALEMFFPRTTQNREWRDVNVAAYLDARFPEAAPEQKWNHNCLVGCSVFQGVVTHREGCPNVTPSAEPQKCGARYPNAPESTMRCTLLCGHSGLHHHDATGANWVTPSAGERFCAKNGHLIPPDHAYCLRCGSYPPHPDQRVPTPTEGEQDDKHPTCRSALGCGLIEGHKGEHVHCYPFVRVPTPSAGETKCPHEEILMTAGGPCKRCGFLTSPETATTEQLERHRFAVGTRPEESQWKYWMPAKGVVPDLDSLRFHPTLTHTDDGIPYSLGSLHRSSDPADWEYEKFIVARAVTDKDGTQTLFVRRDEWVHPVCTACACERCTAREEFVNELAQEVLINLKWPISQTLSDAAEKLT